MDRTHRKRCELYGEKKKMIEKMRGQKKGRRERGREREIDESLTEMWRGNAPEIFCT